MEGFIHDVSVLVTADVLKIRFRDLRGGLAAEIVGEVLHIGQGDLQGIFALGGERHGVRADGVSGVLLQLAGQVQPVIAAAAIVAHALHTLGHGHIHLQQVIAAAGVDHNRAFRGPAGCGRADIYAVSAVTGADGDIGIALSNVKVYIIFELGSVIVNLRILHLNGLSLREVKTGHDHVDLGNEDVAGQNGLALRVAVNGILVDDVLFVSRCLVGILCQNVEGKGFRNTAETADVDIAVVLTGGYANRNGFGVLRHMIQRLVDRLLDGVFGFRNGGLDQRVAVSDNRTVRNLRDQTFCGNRDGLHRVGYVRGGLIGIVCSLARDYRIGAGTVVIGFRKCDGRGIVFKFRLVQSIEVFIHNVLCYTRFYYFNDFSAAFRRCQRCGDIHIVCADGEAVVAAFAAGFLRCQRCHRQAKGKHQKQHRHRQPCQHSLPAPTACAGHNHALTSLSSAFSK